MRHHHRRTPVRPVRTTHHGVVLVLLLHKHLNHHGLPHPTSNLRQLLRTWAGECPSHHHHHKHQAGLALDVDMVLRRRLRLAGRQAGQEVAPPHHGALFCHLTLARKVAAAAPLRRCPVIIEQIFYVDFAILCDPS